MKTFVRSGDTVTIHTSVTDGVIDHVPAAVYTINFDPNNGNPILTRIHERFGVEQRVSYFYGPHRKRLELLVKNYQETIHHTGVLLTGQAGGGKSLLAEHLCDRLIALGLPVLMVDRPVKARPLEDIIRAVGPCVVFFDEFGKVYEDEDDRNTMLTLFSAAGYHKVQFIATGNNENEFSEYMLNRPGRFHFHIRYGDLDTEVVEDIMARHDVPATLHTYFRAYAARYMLSVDIMRHIALQIRELNTPEEVIEHLGILNVPKPIVQSWTVWNRRDKEIRVTINEKRTGTLLARHHTPSGPDLYFTIDKERLVQTDTDPHGGEIYEYEDEHQTLTLLRSWGGYGAADLSAIIDDSLVTSEEDTFAPRRSYGAGSLLSLKHKGIDHDDNIDRAYPVF